MTKILSSGINWLLVIVASVVMNMTTLASTSYATSPGRAGTLYRYGDGGVRAIDPDTGIESWFEQTEGYNTTYFDITSDGQNYMSMHQQYGDSGYVNTPLTYSNLSGELIHNFGNLFDNTYYNSMSPDGSMIAYYDVDDNYISLLDLSTTQIYNLGVPGYMDLVWSPDSSKIAFLHYNWNDPSAGTYSAYMDVNSGDITRITNLSGFPLDWSPDGKYIAFTNEGKAIKQYNTSNAAVSDINPGGILDGSEYIESFSWSPDAQNTALITRDSITSAHQLHIADGTNPTDTISSSPLTDYGRELKWAPSPDSTNVYRFWSSRNQHHFYTASFLEALSVMTVYPNDVWEYEGVAFGAREAQACGIGGPPVYRFWSDTQQGHFYTSSEQEKNSVIANYPPNVWKYEGVAYCSLDPSSPSAIPVFRFWSDTQQGHFYTSSEQEKNSVIANYPPNVWKYEGVAYYVY